MADSGPRELTELRDQANDEIYRLLLDALEHQWAQQRVKDLLHRHAGVILEEIVRSAVSDLRAGELLRPEQFKNVTGAIAASIMFSVLVASAKKFAFLPEVPFTDHIAEGPLEDRDYFCKSSSSRYRSRTKPRPVKVRRTESR